MYGAWFYSGAESTKADSHEMEYEMSREKTLFHIFACTDGTEGEGVKASCCWDAKQPDIVHR